jgi:NADPH:quinone reductase-like Zn-dependent oxidoreductase
MRLTRTSASDVIVELRAAAINPSDVKAAIGMMPYAVFPRTPGRDYAGVVIDGPAEWVGKEVFGSSGDLGIRRDGTHATHLVVEAEALVAKPDNVSTYEAAGIGVPFVTAIEGYRRAGLPKPGETVLVMGVNGKVGQAAAQIAAWRGARVLGVVRKSEPYAGFASAPVEIVDKSKGEVATQVRDLTNGKGADIVFNTVGDPYFQDAHKSLAILGRQIIISAIDKIVQFNLFEFYRGRHTYVGIDSLALSSIATGAVLRELAPGFAEGKLKPFPIEARAVYGLGDANKAYVASMSSARDRLVFDPTR